MATNNLQQIIPTLFAQSLRALRTKSVMIRAVNNDYSTETAKKGSVIQVPIPSSIVAVDVQPGAYAPDPQAIGPFTASIPLNNWKEAPFAVTEDQAAAALDGVVPMELSAAVEAIANAVNLSIFGLHTGVYGFVGTPGQTPFNSSTSAAVQARKTLLNQLAPDGERSMVLNPDAGANALMLPAFSQYLQSGDRGPIMKGELGEKFGFMFVEDQRVPYHVSGTQTGTVTCTGTQAIGQGATSGGLYGVVNIAVAAGGGATYNVGDIISFAGDAQTYAVTAAATIAGASSGMVSISPALLTAKVGGEVVTLQASHVVNLAFHKDAFALASRKLKNDDFGVNTDNEMTMTDPVSGLTMRLSYRPEFHRTRFALDVLWGVGLIRPQLAVRVAG